MHKTSITRLVLFVTLLLVGPSRLLHTQELRSKKSIQNLVKISESIEALAELIRPGVVQIFSESYVPGRGIVSSAAGLVERQSGSGSGVVLAADGYIVTNAHVVSGASRVRVMLPIPPQIRDTRKSILKPRGKLVGAQVVGIDRETDLAVLKVAEAKLPYLRLGDSDELLQGQLVLAFGSPLGLENSVSMGVVSSVARQLRPEDPMVYIQTDATINPGNSGGPLVNARGEVIGINTMIFSQSGGSEGIGFAAPSNIVRNVFQQIRSKGYVQRGEIGVHVQTITRTMAQGLGLPQAWGVVVSDVYQRSPASIAGLHIGDLILTLNSKVMENARQFSVNLYRREIGETVTLEVLREDVKKTMNVVVAERKDDPVRLQAFVRPEKNLIRKLAILCLDIDARIRQMLPPMRKRFGVVVAARAMAVPVSGGGFMPGDIIYAINGGPIYNLENLRTKVAALKLGDAIVAQVERRRELRYVVLEVN